MKRREFITLIGGAATWPLAVRAQQIRRVGVLMNAAATDAAPLSYVTAFVEALAQLGWTRDQNIRIDVRWNAGDAALARAYAAQLIGLQPDVILSASTTNLMILRQATNTVPIVFVQVSDPVAQGFVPNVARPGGNLTGFSAFEFSIGGKWVDLLKQIMPELERVAVVFNPDSSPQTKYFMRSIESTARALGVQATAVPIRTLDDIEPALEKFAQQPKGGLIFPTGGFLNIHRKTIIELVSRHRLPAIGSSAEFAKDGGLLYYGFEGEAVDQYRRAASYVDRILKGVKPADLPVQLATEFELIINLRAAAALGLTIPPTFIARADEVIE